MKFRLKKGLAECHISLLKKKEGKMERERKAGRNKLERKQKKIERKGYGEKNKERNEGGNEGK
jgi:hypothetical protein